MTEITSFFIRRYLDDNYAKPENFWPGLIDFKDSFIRHFHSIPAGSPILVSGDWGVGKTSFLQVVKAELTSSGHTCVWFDAWRYEYEEGLLPALIRKVWEDAITIKGDDEEILGTCLKAAVMLGVRSIPAMLNVLSGGFLSGMFNGFNASSMDKELKSLTYSPQESPTDILRKEFGKLTKKASRHNKPLVIFIDDLDRCNPESAIQLLDHIRQLINVVSVDEEKNITYRFVIAMDKTTLKDAVALKYAEINKYDSNRYLEKLFPFSFTLPVLQQQEINDFIARQSENLNLNSGSMGYIYGYSRNNINQLFANVMIREYFSNPRLIKRCINRFYMLCQCENQFSDKPGDIKSPDESELNRMIIWLAAIERWPPLRKALLTKPTSFWLEMLKAVKGMSTITDEVGQNLLLYRGFKIFFQQHFATDTKEIVRHFQQIEQRLCLHGL